MTGRQGRPSLGASSPVWSRQRDCLAQSRADAGGTGPRHTLGGLGNDCRRGKLGDLRPHLVTAACWSERIERPVTAVEAWKARLPEINEFERELTMDGRAQSSSSSSMSAPRSRRGRMIDRWSKPQQCTTRSGGRPSAKHRRAQGGIYRGLRRHIARSVRHRLRAVARIARRTSCTPAHGRQIVTRKYGRAWRSPKQKPIPRSTRRRSNSGLDDGRRTRRTEERQRSEAPACSPAVGCRGRRIPLDE